MRINLFTSCLLFLFVGVDGLCAKNHKACSGPLPPAVSSFCEAILDGNFNEAKIIFSKKVKVKYTKFDGPKCKAVIRELEYEKENSKLQGVLENFAKATKYAIESPQEKVVFERFEENLYGTLQFGDCPHYTTIQMDSAGSRVIELSLDDPE